ncbi:MAG: flagellar biosynthesis protein FlhA [Acidimicrobiia bacterium]
MTSNRISQVIIPAAIVGIVVLMVVPIPAPLLDLLIVVNIAAAILALLSAMFVRSALDLSIFPSFLLIATLFRLGLNIAASRLVLLDAYAGSVIESFGHFVVGGSVIVGLVIFLILIVIQFVVITNGAGRVAEVGARFTLDAMPGKQMAIDADLNAGLVDEEEARRRRKEISDEADFYGAMDGASKFVKGDAIAAIVIVMINLVGGFAVGVLQHGMSIEDALQTYSLLTVGDGLVSQIPALLISLSAGLIVTRAATEADLGTDLLAQFTQQRRTMRMAGIAVAILAIVPGIPKFPFLLVGGLIMFVGSRAGRRDASAAGDEPAEEDPASSAPDSADALTTEMRVEPLELELAYDLVDLVDTTRGGDLLDRVRALRRKLAREMGFVIPPVRTRDNLDLASGCYRVKVHGVEYGSGEAPPGHALAIGEGVESLPGRRTREPVFGLTATWVPLELRAQAELARATVIDRASVITTHLAEIVRRHAGRLLSRQDVKSLLDVVREESPVVVEDLSASGLTLGEMQRVLQALLDEGVPIRDLVRICEVLSERAQVTKDAEALTEAVRGVLGPAIAELHAPDGVLPVLSLDPLVEQELLEVVRPGESGGTNLALDPARAEALVGAIAREAQGAERLGHQPVLVCAAPLRPALRRLVTPVVPRLTVLAYGELGPQLQVETVGMVSNEQPATI